MRSIWKDSTHLTYGGDGHLGAVQVNQALTGDPLTGSGWLEPQTGLDEVLYGIGSSGPWDLLPGDTLTLELAYVFARDYDGDHLASVSLLKERIERIRWFYENDSTPCETPWTDIPEQSPPAGRMLLVPNPAQSFIAPDKFEDYEWLEYEIFDIRGLAKMKGRILGGQKINISGWPPGCYLVRFYNFEEVFTSKFIKTE
jgi:hypothetical protein